MLDDPGEAAMGSGIAADRAFRLTRGDPSVVLAVLDSGIESDSPHLRKKVRLHEGERTTWVVRSTLRKVYVS